MKGAFAVLCAAGALAACGESREPADERVDAYAAELGTNTETARRPAGANASATAEANDVWDFAYSWPAAAGRIAPLRALLEDRRDAAFAELKEEAIDGRATADEEGFDFHPYSLSVEWRTVADLPRWLSLSAEISDYKGGAHGNHGFDALLWDKQTNRSRSPESLFEPGALEAAVRPAFCAALNAQRAERRGAPVPPDSTDMFDQCPGLDETRLILGSSNNRTFDRIGFLIGPYVAGPYAEGTFEVTLPVTRAVKAAAKPPYTASFTAIR